MHSLCPHEKEKSYDSSHFHIRKLKHKNTSNLPRIPMGLEVKPSQAGPRGYALNHCALLLTGVAVVRSQGASDYGQWMVV